jgi:hypothetical protein
MVWGIKDEYFEKVYGIKPEKKMKLPPYKDEALLVAHLLGGRYGFEHDDAREITMEQRVGEAIKVAREIRRQLALLDPVAFPEKEESGQGELKV